MVAETPSLLAATVAAGAAGPSARERAAAHGAGCRYGTVTRRHIGLSTRAGQPPVMLPGPFGRGRWARRSSPVLPRLCKPLGRRSVSSSGRSPLLSYLLWCAVQCRPGCGVRGGRTRVHDPPQRRVGLAVPTTVEPVTDLFARGGIDRARVHTGPRSPPRSGAGQGCRRQWRAK